MNIAFFGSDNSFSAAIFRNLLQTLSIKVVVLPGAQSFAPPPVPPQLQLRFANEQQNFIESLAQQHSIHVIHHAGLSTQQVAGSLADGNIDIIVVACYPRLISALELDASLFGAINVHPSLLPNYRGPAPVFWQLRNNETHTGVSVHCVSGLFDAGDIVKQSAIEIPWDATGPDIDRLLANAGSDLLAEVCSDTDSLQKSISSAIPQQELLASYQHAPNSTADFELSLSWSAQHAFRFMRGTQHYQTPYPIKINNTNLRLSQVISYSTGQTTEPIVYQNDSVASINFRMGSICAHYLIEKLRD